MSGRRIALVDDDQGVRMIAATALERIGGHTVQAFASGEAALAGAAAFRPDLLLLDVAMPGIDGPRTLQALRQQPALAAVPAVFLTAGTQAGRVNELRQLGACDVIAKPFDPQQLCQRIEAVLARPEGGQPRAQGPLALVVEDDPGIRYLIGFVLQQHGWRVAEAHDGRQGQSAIVQGPVADAVLLDLMLPGIDGLQLLQQLRALPRWEQVPVMVLTGHGDESTVSRALAAGASDYLVKPFDPAELAARLSRLARR